MRDPSIKNACLTALGLLAVASCGGGGGGGGAPAGPLSDINESNAADALGIVISLIEAPIQLTGLIADTIDTLLALDAAPLTTTCSNGGSIDFDFTDADHNQVPSHGDTLRTDFHQCYQRSLNTIVDGTAVFSFLAPSSPEDDWRGEIDPTDLAIVIEPGVTARFGAPLQFVIARDDLAEVYYLDSTDPVDLVIDDGGTPVTETFVNIQVRKVIDLVAAEYRISALATLNDELLGGQFQIEATDPLQGLWSSFPDRGYFRVQGRDGSAARTRPPGPVPGNQVTIELDEDGDGSYTTLAQPDFWSNLVEGFLWWEPRTGSDPATVGYVTRNAGEKVFSLAWANITANQPVRLSPEIIFQFPLLVDPTSSPTVLFIAQAPVGDIVPGTLEVRGAQVVIRTTRPLLDGATYYMAISGDVNSTTGSSVSLPGFPVLATADL